MPAIPSADEVLVLRVRLSPEKAQQIREMAERTERSLNWTASKLIQKGLEVDAVAGARVPL